MTRYLRKYCPVSLDQTKIPPQKCMIDLCKTCLWWYVLRVHCTIYMHKEKKPQRPLMSVVWEILTCTILLVISLYQWIVVKLDTIIDNFNFILCMNVRLYSEIFVYDRELEWTNNYIVTLVWRKGSINCFL